jgi:hypothetical protein
MSNILVIGDIMIDKYIYTNISKLANESPIPVFSYSNEKYIPFAEGLDFSEMYLLKNNTKLALRTFDQLRQIKLDLFK